MDTYRTRSAKGCNVSVCASFFAALFGALSQGAPYIVIEYLFAALIKEFIPVRVMAQQFGNRGVVPLLKAVVIGAILPICSCGVIPLGIGAFKCGTARGTTLAFMTASPTISPVLVLLSLSMLGPKFTLTFACVALCGSLLVGLLGNWLLGGEAERRFRAQHDATLGSDEQIPASTQGSIASKLKGAIHWAFWDLGSDVSVDLLIGLIIAAAVTVFLPMDWIASWLGKQQFTTLIFVMLLGIPVYTCSIPTVPVVRSLLLLGMSPGAAVAYLFSGPATNLGELKAIQRALGWRTAAFFAGGLFCMAIAGGMITDHLIFSDYHFHSTVSGSNVLVTECCVPMVFGEQGRAEGMQSALGRVPGWHWPFIAALGVTLVLGIGRRVMGYFTRPATPAASAAAAAEVGRSDLPALKA